MVDSTESYSLQDGEMPMKTKRKQRAIMIPIEDVLLLKEAVVVFPWGLARNDRGNAWKSIADIVNRFLDDDRHLDARRARERVTLLLDKHKISELESLRAPGTDEEYSKREQLLADLSEMITDEATVTKASVEEKKEEERQGEFLRRVAMETMTEADGSGDNTKLPKLKPRKKARLSEVEKKLESFMESEQNSRKQEIALLERSQMLEEGRQALENRRLTLKENRIEFERLDRYNQQQQILQLMSMLTPNSKISK